MIPNCNDGTQQAPYIRQDITYSNVSTLPDESSGPKGDDRARHQAIKEAGFQGIQGGDPALCREMGLGCTTSGRVNQPGEIVPLAQRAQDDGYECLTLHVGWGMENDDEASALVEDILQTATRRAYPIYIETHRATITQDLYRTVRLTERFPEIRFNGDFSHWYTGLEMVYGGFENKLAFIMPVIERVRFVHGRIGNPGSMQVDIGDGQGRSYVEHFREMWTRSFAAFLASATPGDFLCFAPELLASSNYYARTFPGADGKDREEGDRWQQALLYRDLATDCASAAQERVKGSE